MRGGGSLFFGRGMTVQVSMICKSQTRGAAALVGDLPASDLVAERQARRGGVPIRRLARSRRPVVVAGPAARAARRVRLSVPHDLGVRGLAGAARGAGRAGFTGGDPGLRRT